MKMLKSIQGFLRRSKKILLLTIIVAAIAIALATILYMLFHRSDGNYLLPSLGIMRTTGVKVYGGNLTVYENGEQYMDWGMVYTGTSTNRSFYVQSKSNVETTLIFKFENWTFLNYNNNDVSGSLPTPHTRYMNVTCPQNGTIVSPNEIVYITLTLSADASSEFINAIVTNNIRKFSFDTHIHAKE